MSNSLVDKKDNKFIKKSIQLKIDEMAKSLGVSNGSVIELLINDFEQK